MKRLFLYFLSGFLIIGLYIPVNAAVFEVNVEAKIKSFSFNMHEPLYSDIASEYGAVGDTLNWKLRYDDNGTPGASYVPFDVLESPNRFSTGFTNRGIELRNASSSSDFSWIVLDGTNAITNIYYYIEKDAIYLLGGYNQYNWVRETGDDSPARHVYFKDIVVTRTLVNTPVPLPSSILLLGMGLLPLMKTRRKAVQKR